MKNVILMLLCLVGMANALLTITYGKQGDSATSIKAFGAVPATLTDDVLTLQKGRDSLVSNITKTVILAGHTWTDSCDTANFGDPTKGSVTYINCGAVSAYTLSLTGPGTFKMLGRRFLHLASSASAYGVSIGTSTVNPTIIFAGNIFNGDNKGGRGLQIGTTNVTAYVYNNLFHRYGYGCLSTAANVNSYFENNTADSCTTAGFYANGCNWNNNLAWGSGVDFAITSPAIGKNNASQDTTAKDAQWYTGSTGNIIGIVPDSEFVKKSITDTNWVTLRNAGATWNGGRAVAIAENIVDIRQHSRPGSDAVVSIGANEYFVADSDWVSMTDIHNYQLYQRNPTAATVAISGTYHDVKSVAKSVQARILQNGTTTEVQTWTTVALPVSGSTWSGSLSVPQGGWYRVQIRTRGADSVAIDTFTGANKFGSGDIGDIAGQSQATGLDSTHTYTSADDHVVMYDSVLGWVHLADPMRAAHGFGATQFPRLGNLLYADRGVPIGFVNRAVGGTYLEGTTGAAWVYRNPANHQDSTTRYGNALMATLKATGGARPAFTIWHQGEADCSFPAVTPISYRDSLRKFIDNRIEDFGGADSFYVIQIARFNNSGAFDSTAPAVRCGQQLIDGYHGARLAALTIDLPLWVDSLHLPWASQESLAVRTFNFIKSSKRGPYISAVTYIGSDSSKVSLTVTQNGTVLSPSNAVGQITGLQKSNGASISPDSSRASGNTYSVYFPAKVTAVRYLWKALPTISGLVYDNQSPALPMEPLYTTTVTSSGGARPRPRGIGLGVGISYRDQGRVSYRSLAFR